MYCDVLLVSWLSLVVIANKAAALALPTNDSTVPTFQNLSFHHDLNYRCTSSPTWYPSDRSTFYEDCQIAYDDFDMTEILTHEHVPYEFLSETARPSEPGMEIMQTPRRYTHGQWTCHILQAGYQLPNITDWRVLKGTCTWAVVSLADITIGLLPAGPTGPFPKSDVAYWEDFDEPATYGLDFGCLRNRHNVGYAIVGEFSLPPCYGLNRLTFTVVDEGQKSSLAILVFGTRSIFDRQLPRGFHPPLLWSDGTRNSIKGSNDAAMVPQVLNEATSPSQGTNMVKAS